MANQTDQFNQTRREAEITSAEFADFLGMSRRYAFQLETGREPITAGIMNALNAMITEKGKA